MAGPPGEGARRKPNFAAGDAFASGAAIAYASYRLAIKRLRRDTNGAIATLWSAAVSAAVLMIAARLHGEKMIPTSALDWTAVVPLAQPPASALLARLVLGEAMGAPQIAGGAIILVGVLLASPLRAFPSRRSWPSRTSRR
jgi:drug/metabolite transporter (DMT)-like permease